MNLGYCCVLLGESKSQFRTITLKSVNESKYPKEKLFHLYNTNLNELCRVLEYNISKNYKVYRISSDLFPMFDHKDYFQYFDEYKTNNIYIENAKKTVVKYLDWGGRLSTHPGQFVSISSPREEVRKTSIFTLERHGEMFDFLGLPKLHVSPINIHINNGKNVESVVEYVNDSLSKLSDSVKSRLVFENEDKGGWTWQAIRKHFPQIPITLDYHHWNINNASESLQDAIKNCFESWGNIKPLFHYSEGKTHQLDCSHSDFITKLPETFGYDFDIEIEAKMKNLAIDKIYFT